MDRSRGDVHHAPGTRRQPRPRHRTPDRHTRRARPTRRHHARLNAVAALAAILATRNSRWYVSPFGTALIVLLISGINGTTEFQVSFHDRILETTIGALAVILATAARIIADHHTATPDTSP